MRTNSISISERDLMFAIVGQLYSQAPNRQPRKSEIIMQKVRDAFRKDAYNDNEHYALIIVKDTVYKYLENLLKEIPEFVELNLSQIEFEKNISVEDESRPKYSFATRYDKYSSESWKTDFIDLDAFIGNVHYKLLSMMEIDQDCFCCKHKSTELCNTCLINPILKNNYEGSRKPKGSYTFSCKFDCHAHRQICCDECKEKDSCASKCDGKSDICGNKVNE